MKFLARKKMMKINKIWFEGDWLYGLGDDGKTYRQSLLWYKRLMEASPDERAEFEISTIGIHWPRLDEKSTSPVSHVSSDTIPPFFAAMSMDSRHHRQNANGKSWRMSPNWATSWQ